MKETIAAGGSYIVNGVQSTGISFGMERISQLAEIKSGEIRILMISIGEDKKAIGIIQELRKQGIESLIMYGKISKALEYANAYSVPYVLFLGKQEVKSKKIKLRDMASGKEKLLTLKGIVNIIKK
jgi:histidyl-tRNA synthetase